MASTHFADVLLTAIEKKGTPLIVGIDPVYEQLPESIRSHRELNDADDAEAAVDAILEFCTRLLKVVAPHVPAVKINSAFFERYYAYGVEAFVAVVQEAAAHGLIVINDAKRADIGNSSERYALAAFADPEFETMEGAVGADAVTVNPYMGSDSVVPFIKIADDQDKGVFVLVRTSNPGAAEIQDAILQDGTPVYQHVGKLVAKWGAELIGERGYSAVGAVVGATNPGQLAALREMLPSVLFLVPGYGGAGWERAGYCGGVQGGWDGGDHQFIARDYLCAQGGEVCGDGVGEGGGGGGDCGEGGHCRGAGAVKGARALERYTGGIDGHFWRKARA